MLISKMDIFAFSFGDNITDDVYLKRMVIRRTDTTSEVSGATQALAVGNYIYLVRNGKIIKYNPRTNTVDATLALVDVDALHDT